MITNEFELYKFQTGRDLPDIFASELNTFSNIHNPNVADNLPLYELLDRIKYGFTLPIYKYVNYQKNPEYDKLKAQKPAVCYAATFAGYKKISNIQSISNLMFLDIDLSSVHEAEVCRKYFLDKNLGKGWDWIVSCNLSLSRTGLHFIIWLDEIVDSEDYKQKYDYINTTYFENKLDGNAKSIAQFAIIPFDYSIYINDNPTPLNISQLFNPKQSTTSQKIFHGDIVNVTLNNGKYISDEKSIWSCNIKEREIMTTPYTFSSTNTGGYDQTNRSVILKFSETPDDVQFQNSNEPIYFHEGRKVIKINLFPLLNRNVPERYRTVTLGAISAKMIYLNANNSEYTQVQMRNAILNFMLWLNQKICDPPLPYHEVVNSFAANWNKYLAGKLDVGNLTTKQRSFWSPNSTLNTNEKRKISCKLYYEQIVSESNRKISDAIEKINLSGEKVTQVKVAEISGLKLPTVKKYWKDDIKSLVKDLNLKLRNL